MSHGFAAQTERAARVCQTCKSRKKRCDKVTPTCGYCAKRGLDCVYESSDQGSEASSDPNRTYEQRITDTEERCNLYTVLLLPSLISSRSIVGEHPTLNESVARNVRCFFERIGLSPYQACERFLQNFQRWLQVIAPHRLRQATATYPHATTRADVSVLLLAMCLVTMRTHAGPSVPTSANHATVYVAVKTLYAQVQALIQTSMSLVQAGVIISAYEYASGRIDSAYISIGVNIRMARAVSMDTAHIEITAREDGASSLAVEKWNVWWAIIVLERFVSSLLVNFHFTKTLLICPKIHFA